MTLIKFYFWVIGGVGIENFRILKKMKNNRLYCIVGLTYCLKENIEWTCDGKRMLLWWLIVLPRESQPKIIQELADFGNIFWVFPLKLSNLFLIRKLRADNQSQPAEVQRFEDVMF